MIWTIIILVVAFILIKFFIELSKDKDDLQGQTLDKKFNVIINMLNDVVFNGNGAITKIDNRELNLYEVGTNQLVKLQYSTGSLTIDWRYKYYQKEIVHSKQYNNVRNLSLFEQQKIAKAFIDEGLYKIEIHKLSVSSDIF
ncbi:hypothetical protein EKM01_12880 [Flavobacterium sp. RSP46]|uniref:hypothetical protein n=1 Tax=Flavobacterium sp. RSP46 TaxID=2497486 RepID=UPI000F896BAA|nr:hypothetical protein [Flavobacterium sp. RSP46]RTY89998.1 hypothetical protein EKM01_12880 [Flavobacterium sp. RSP46]